MYLFGCKLQKLSQTALNNEEDTDLLISPIRRSAEKIGFQSHAAVKEQRQDLNQSL